MNLIRFKSSREEGEWHTGKLDSRLAALLFTVAGYAGANNWGPVTVTGIYYTHDEVIQWYNDPDAPPSVHEFWRGLDLRSKKWSITHCEQLERWINRHFRYDDQHDTAKFHSVMGYHFHLQVPHSGDQRWGSKEAT